MIGIDGAVPVLEDEKVIPVDLALGGIVGDISPGAGTRGGPDVKGDRERLPARSRGGGLLVAGR